MHQPERDVGVFGDLGRYHRRRRAGVATANGMETEPEEKGEDYVGWHVLLGSSVSRGNTARLGNAQLSGRY